MSTQTRASGGGGGRNQKKSNSTSGGGGGVSESATHATVKKTDASKTEKEKVQPKPTAEQLRIAQITNSNTNEDPQMSMKVTMLLEMTQRSEEDVCCALNECDYDLDAAVNFLLESLPVGAFEKSSKKKKNKAANAAGDGAVGDGEWADTNANVDRREKSRNRSSNRGGRGGTDSRGWRGREARENERNQRDSRGGGDREDRGNENRGGQRNGAGGRNGPGGGGRGGGYIGRSGRGGGRMGGRGSGGVRSERGGYGSRNHTNDDHQEVELWDNTIAQNAEKQQHLATHDDAWGDWNNEEYEGSLKDSKVFTTSNIPNQTTASVVSSGISGDLSAPPGLEHHLGTSVLGGNQQGSHLSALVGSSVGTSSTTGTGLGDENTVSNSVLQTSSTPLMYSAAVSNPPPLQQQQQASSASSSNVTAALNSSTQFSPADSFSNAATAAATLVQQVQQQQQQPSALKSSATLSAEQSQYFNSLTSQNTPASVQQQSAISTYAQNASYGQNSSSVQYPTSYANVFGSGGTGSVASGTDQSQLVAGNQQPQVRRARAKLPPPSKIPSSAVEMPGDTMNNIGYLDVQFGALDFGTDDTFDALPEKFNTAVNIDGQQKQQDVVNDYQNKQQQQSALSASLQNAQIGDALSAGSYAQRASNQQQQVVSGGNSVSASNALDQLTKNDPYNQSNAANSASYQNTYQTNAANKSNSAYQPTAQAYNSSSYANVQSSVSNSYQPQSYGSYQQNSVNSYQQQQQVGGGSQSVSNSVAGSSAGVNSTQNIPVGGSGSQSSATANSNTGGYLSSGYSTQQSAYQSSQSVYSTGLSNSTGFAGSTSNATSQYSNFSANSKLKDAGTASSTSHYESVSANSGVSSAGGSVVNAAGAVSSSGANAANVVTNSNNNSNVNSSNSSSVAASNNNVVSGNNQVSTVTGASGNSVAAGGNTSSTNNNAASVSAQTGSAAAAAVVLSSLTNKNSSSATSGNTTGGGPGAGGTSGGGSSGTGGSSTAGGGGMVPTNIQMVSQYIQTGLPYYQQPVYSYDELQMMQQRVPHVQGYYDLNYTPTSLGAGRDNLGSVAYSTMTDGRFARTDNNSSPVSNVSSTMSQQAGSSGPMLNVPYAYFYGGNVMPSGFQYGAPAIYPQQIPAANTASGGQFPKPSYNAGYGTTSYDTLSQASQDYTKAGYSSSLNQQNKTQNVTNQPQAGTGSDITSSMYGKPHVALNKVNSYEKQNFHSGTPPPFNMPNTQTAGGTSAQPFGMYLPMAPAAGHAHNMIHQPIHQMDGRIHNSSRRDSNSTGQRQQTSSQSKSAAKQGYSPSYWTGQN